MKRCVVHNNNAMLKDRHCSGWWWANGGDPKAGLAEPCEFEPDPQQSEGLGAGECVCAPGEGCDAEGEPGCEYCRSLDGEYPCPVDDDQLGFDGSQP